MEKALEACATRPSRQQSVRLGRARDGGPAQWVVIAAEATTELIDIIRDHAPHALLWRCVSAVSLASRVSSMEPAPLLTLPLCDIVSWERCGELNVASPVSLRAAALPVRLTIDTDGISKVERLSCPPQYEAQCVASSAFVIVHVESISGVALQLKDGFVRLQMPSGWTFPVWNTPSPPNLSSCRIYTSHSPYHWMRFYAVEMDRIRGITFFYSGGKLLGVHSHLSEGECATATYECFPNRCRRRMAWIYLPISKADRVLVLGVREQSHAGLNILVRTRLTGDVVIGKPITGDAKNLCLGRSAPITLIHGEPKEGFPVPYFGAYCRRAADACLLRPFPSGLPSPSPVDGDSYFSWAPLDDISSTRVFSDPITGFCRGILLQYRNGGARALGQCRLQVDTVERVVEPRMLCSRTEICQSRWRQTIHQTQVFFQHNPQHEQDNEWKYHGLEGIVQFWFTDESSFLVVIK